MLLVATTAKSPDVTVTDGCGVFSRAKPIRGNFCEDPRDDIGLCNVELGGAEHSDRGSALDITYSPDVSTGQSERSM
jgi:hypothetical protein